MVIGAPSSGEGDGFVWDTVDDDGSPCTPRLSEASSKRKSLNAPQSGQTEGEEPGRATLANLLLKCDVLVHCGMGTHRLRQSYGVFQRHIMLARSCKDARLLGHHGRAMAMNSSGMKSMTMSQLLYSAAKQSSVEERRRLLGELFWRICR